MYSSSRNKILFFVVISLLIHFLFVFLLKDSFLSLGERTIPPAPVWVELKQMEPPLKIADIPKPAQEEIPERASAQALYNQKAAEETVNPSPPVPQTRKNDAMRTPDQKQELPSPQQASPRMPGIPTEETSDMSSSIPEDYFPDYKIGNRTYINTLANPNIRYFVELKRRFRTAFNPLQALRGHASDIHSRQIDVVLGVSVNPQGEIVDLILIRSSGLESYDFEGKRTIKSSAPFSAPPPELMTEDGLLHMAWTFIVYL